MKYIHLAGEMFAKVDDDDYEWLNQFTWHPYKRSTGTGYDVIAYYFVRDAADRPWIRRIRMSHLVMGVAEGKHVDHCNRNTLDNQSENLRLGTPQQNSRNRKRPNKWGYTGVNRNRSGKFIARINVDVDKRICLGSFETPEQAAAAYNLAAVKHFGEWAVLNEIQRKGKKSCR